MEVELGLWVPKKKLLKKYISYFFRENKKHTFDSIENAMHCRLRCRLKHLIIIQFKISLFFDLCCALQKTSHGFVVSTRSPAYLGPRLNALWALHLSGLKTPGMAFWIYLKDPVMIWSSSLSITRQVFDIFAVENFGVQKLSISLDSIKL